MQNKTKQNKTKTKTKTKTKKQQQQQERLLKKKHTKTFWNLHKILIKKNLGSDNYNSLSIIRIKIELKMRWNEKRNCLKMGWSGLSEFWNILFKFSFTYTINTYKYIHSWQVCWWPVTICIFPKVRY